MTSIEEGRIWLRVRERSGIQFDPIDSCCDEAEGDLGAADLKTTNMAEEWWQEMNSGG
uniref:Uncharacterized protein n=1 Tax=Oryza sativa subsp. japonica TaxID=39947 RepID=Q6YWH8_ORYSJ|nr:hypothetical protein [Oryza sativa Japonica Group]